LVFSSFLLFAWWLIMLLFLVKQFENMVHTTQI
jgi:hypothetical protein